VSPVERRLAGEQLVEDDAERVEVGALVDLAPRACSGERYCAVPTIEPVSVIWLVPARAIPKSVTFHAPLAVDEDVVRLDVAVHDAVPVREAERREDLARVLDRDVDRRGAAA
jgi:hypothetical protein